MPLTLSSTYIAEKNKLSSQYAWVILLDINFEGESTLRLAWNTDDVVWGGNTYQKYAFEFDELVEDGKGALPVFGIRIANPGRLLMPYLEESSGGVGATVTVYVVHSNNLSEAEAAIEETFEVIETTADAKWVYFKLGAEHPMLQRFPKQRYLKDHCRYKEFGGSECAYEGLETDCNRTLERCIELENQARFGGFPGMAYGGVYA